MQWLMIVNYLQTARISNKADSFVLCFNVDLVLFSNMKSEIPPQHGTKMSWADCVRQYSFMSRSRS